jgi:hypothetical protein
MDNEKKIKLDELPDQGSDTPEIKPHPKPRTSKPDPRIENLKTMNSGQRVEAMTQRWHFDKPKQNWGWLVALVILLALEKSGHWRDFTLGMQNAAEKTDGLSNLFAGDTPFHFLFKHPLVWAALIPAFFKFRVSSEVFFEITFDGINAVRNIVYGSHQSAVRVKLRWEEITEVTKLIIDKREVLVLHTATGPAGQMIWDIEDVKKKVIKQVVKGLVSNKNVFRIFIEKEVA